jgi:enamine deaminase RidA (YjgF/YER057c/UK114 family)
LSGRQEIRVPGQAEPISHYTDAVRAGDLLFVSGCVSVDGEGRLVGGDQELFGEARPASTLVEVSALAVPGAKLEVEAVALVP